MRYLGIDYGSVRIGIARSDEEGNMAFPDRVISDKNPHTAIGEIQKIAEDAKAGAVVIGLPLGLDGSETETSRRVRHFAERAGAVLRLPIYLENELFTSRMADHEGVAKDQIDAASAAIILQSFLDKQRLAHHG
ncbi:MAG: Holliday junction resolvase RuvX [Patescibacteria group bacterium]